jgi:hypothetical protein
MKTFLTAVAVAILAAVGSAYADTDYTVTMTGVT